MIEFYNAIYQLFYTLFLFNLTTLCNILLLSISKINFFLLELFLTNILSNIENLLSKKESFTKINPNIPFYNKK